MKNWWYYYKWYVICGLILLGVAVHLVGNALGWFKKSPDVQIAYVGKTALPDDTQEAVQAAFASLAGDYNGDGRVLVQVNPFVIADTVPGDAEAAAFHEAAVISLMADINDCESYFFLMEDPGSVQREYQVLACPDGSCPDAQDFSTEDKVLRWCDCQLLTGQELGGYTTTLLGESESGDNQELLAGLYLGRRCFYDERTCENTGGCQSLWESLKGGRK